MSRLTAVLVVLCGVLAGGLVTTLLRPALPPAVDDAAVRAIVNEMLASQPTAEAPANQSVAVLNPATLDPMIEKYLLGNPGILDAMNDKLTETKQIAKRTAQRDTLAANAAAIYDDPSNVILGNPKGDVTLVEMFDYNCGYCRSALPDMAALLAEDPNLRVILKEFPILSQGSVEAARVAVMVQSDPAISYWDFHQQLFSSRGQVTGETALGVAEKLGMNRTLMMLGMEGENASAVLSRSYDLAKALDVSGTPTFIIGDEIIPGAVGLERLKSRIANMRACGSTTCPATGEVPSPAG